MIVLDTNVISELVRPNPDPQVVNWLAEQNDSDLATVTPVTAEIWSGVALLPRGRRASQVAEAVGVLLQAFEGRVWSLDEAAAVEYGAILRERRDIGHPISTMDALIAAVARSHGAAVATRDGDGLRCDGLEIIDPWAHPSATGD